MSGRPDDAGTYKNYWGRRCLKAVASGRRRINVSGFINRGWHWSPGSRCGWECFLGAAWKCKAAKGCLPAYLLAAFLLHPSRPSSQARLVSLTQYIEPWHRCASSISRGLAEMAVSALFSRPRLLVAHRQPVPSSCLLHGLLAGRDPAAL